MHNKPEGIKLISKIKMFSFTYCILLFFFMYGTLVMICTVYIFFSLSPLNCPGGVTLAQLVKLLSCDYKVTGSSPGNSLLCKNRVRLRTIHQMVGPLPGPCVCGSFSAPGCPFSPLNCVYYSLIESICIIPYGPI